VKRLFEPDDVPKPTELLPQYPAISADYWLRPPDGGRPIRYFWSAKSRSWLLGNEMSPAEAWDKGYRFLLTEHEAAP
jgi:hypothetical protein